MGPVLQFNFQAHPGKVVELFDGIIRYLRIMHPSVRVTLDGRDCTDDSFAKIAEGSKWIEWFNNQRILRFDLLDCKFKNLDVLHNFSTDEFMIVMWRTELAFCPSTGSKKKMKSAINEATSVLTLVSAFSSPLLASVTIDQDLEFVSEFKGSYVSSALADCYLSKELVRQEFLDQLPLGTAITSEESVTILSLMIDNAETSGKISQMLCAVNKC
jgi:hypothetical protein